MAATREELREQLVAAFEAAPELPKEARQHLADVFLDELNAGYDLVPRGTGQSPQAAGPAGGPPWSARWMPFALVLAFLVFVLPATFHAHFPIFPFVVLAVFLVVRSRVFGMRRGRPLWR